MRLVALLLEERREPLELFEGDPFDGETPRAIRARRFRYRLGDGEAVWKRELIGEYLRPLTRDDPDLRAWLEARGLRR